MQNLEDFKIKDGRKCYNTKCDSCDTFIGYQRLGRNKTGLCRVCFGKSKKGRTLSDQSKAKMKESHFLKNGGKHPLLNKKHKPETLVKLSVAASKQNANYKPNFIYSGIQMRSSWEVSFARWLDSNNVQWQYEVPFKLKSGKIYLADFIINGSDIIEIKGYFREDAKIKWDQFCEEYSDLKKSIVGKVELKALGII